jgi:uncharacterized protein (AIM24 family)
MVNYEILPGMVPALLVTLAEGESVLSENGVMLYKDDSVKVSRRLLQGNILEKFERKTLGGMPFFITEFIGPGSVAFSRDGKGEIRDFELKAGEIVDIAEGSLLCFEPSVSYDMRYMGGTLRPGRMIGRWMDRLTGPGKMVIHGYGNIVSFDMEKGEEMIVDYGSLLMKHSSVSETPFNHPLGHGIMGHVESFEVLKLSGQGKVLLQSIDYYKI